MNKRVSLIMLFTFLMSYVYSQYYFGATTLPIVATDIDSILVVDTFHLTMSNDYKIFTSIQKSKDTVTLQMCYAYGGGLALAPTLIESTNIGKLPTGKYIIHIKGEMTSSQVCSNNHPFINSLYIPLEVNAFPNGVIKQQTINNSFCTSLIKDKLILGSLVSGIHIEVYDLQGRCYYSTTSSNSSLIINTLDWANGIYIVSVERNGERKRWKVLKE